METRWPDIVDGMMVDRQFAENLLEAHGLQKRLLELENESEEKQHLQASLDTIVTDSRIERLVEAVDLVELLIEMTTSELESLPHYLHLAKITGSGTVSLEVDTKEDNQPERQSRNDDT
jgi:hypothetical protein